MHSLGISQKSYRLIETFIENYIIKRKVRNMSRQSNFYNICRSCTRLCCQDVKPAVTNQRKKIIENHLKIKGLKISAPFKREEYLFSKATEEGLCIFLDKATKQCIIQPVKPEICVAYPITFDINRKTNTIEWYLKIEKSCPLAGVLISDKSALSQHLNVAKTELIPMVQQLGKDELDKILTIEELDTFKIGEDRLPEKLPE